MSSGTKITNFSDRTPRAKLASKNEMDVLASIAQAREYPERARLKIEKLKNEIVAEQARKYPSSDYIARREQKIIEIHQSITWYNMQRRK